jgi:ribosomal protein S21
MLIIPVKEGENIDRALKRFKRKFDKTGTMRQLRSRQQFVKKSVRKREQFGKPISSFQGISFKLADMATEIEAAELLLHKAAYLKNEGRRMTLYSAMSKMYASELCVRVANEAIQIHGGYGYTKDYPVEKFYRDAKLCTIGEGTTEIQKVVIAKNILKD